MTVIVPATPVPFLRSAEETAGSLAEEQEFWSGLSCALLDSTFKPADDQGRWLVTAGIALRAPAHVECLWLRAEIRLGGECRPVGLFPELVTEPSGVTPAVRVMPSGVVERELVPGGGHLPAYTSGWLAPDGTLVWDVNPTTPAVPERLAELTILCASPLPARSPVVDFRIVTVLHSPGLGRRVAAFTGSTTSEESTTMDTDPIGAFIEPVTIFGLADDAEAVLERMTSQGRRFGVLTSEGGISGVVDVDRLRSAPAGATAASVTGWPVPVVDVETPLDDIASVVRAADSPADLDGAVVTGRGVPIGYLTAERVETIVAGEVVRSGHIGGLAGSPVSQLVFECATHQESMSIPYYDPENRPRCSHGDLMVRRRPA
ncbi:hypothetical protein KIPE111705_21780 [Kibdelosporangium persicum]|uniref:CBS domain-containing protein n=1 Tax=Kibdelosporangium persicum TaxID=2698649 RepID=A0ABX2FDE2_9PSEU|nr:hypothetical protein [Kibdelosporangium persicum]NRN69386.1 hypothetical protein [Kibdelosporangium persicum]